MARHRLLTAEELAQPFRAGPWADQFPPILSPVQLAALLNVSRKTIDHWVALGRLDGCVRRRGKHLLIWRDKVLDLLFNGPEWRHHDA